MCVENNGIVTGSLYCILCCTNTSILNKYKYIHGTRCAELISLPPQNSYGGMEFSTVLNIIILQTPIDVVLLVGVAYMLLFFMDIVIEYVCVLRQSHSNQQIVYLSNKVTASV